MVAASVSYMNLFRNIQKLVVLVWQQEKLTKKQRGINLVLRNQNSGAKTLFP